MDRKSARKTISHIWVLDNGTLKQVAVKLGIGDDSFTEILEGDVKEGQNVVVGETIPLTAIKGQQKVPWGRPRF